MCAGFRQGVEKAGTGWIVLSRIFGAFFCLRADKLCCGPRPLFERRLVMQRSSTKVALAVLMILALFFALEAGLAFAQEKIKFSFKETTATVKREAFEVGDVKGHWVGLREYEGNQMITTGPRVLDGAIVTGVVFFDVIQGNGSAHGYSKAVKGPNSYVMKYECQIRPSTLPDGSPTTKYEGTWIIINGTGELEGIKGDGTFRGTSISKNISVSEDQGEYWIER
jgi:hypothetical protein